MADHLKKLKDLLGRDYVYVGKYFECTKEVNGHELAETIDALIQRRIAEAIDAMPLTREQMKAKLGLLG